jgi:anti-sigma regulatory factor (Ser/Thr protein kinase)
VVALSPFVDRLRLWCRKCGCVSEGESDVEIALREARANAIIHGNHENLLKQVPMVVGAVNLRTSPIGVKDEGRGFDIHPMANPTAPENIGSVHGRGIWLMKALMDEVRFEEGGVVVHMRTSTGPSCSQKMHREPEGID